MEEIKIYKFQLEAIKEALRKCFKLLEIDYFVNKNTRQFNLIIKIN